jgi:hypothetical protein
MENFFWFSETSGIRVAYAVYVFVLCFVKFLQKGFYLAAMDKLYEYPIKVGGTQKIFVNARLLSTSVFKMAFVLHIITHNRLLLDFTLHF